MKWRIHQVLEKKKEISDDKSWCIEEFESFTFKEWRWKEFDVLFSIMKIKGLEITLFEWPKQPYLNELYVFSIGIKKSLTYSTLKKIKKLKKKIRSDSY